jgi:hypothetical protein
MGCCTSRKKDKHHESEDDEGLSEEDPLRILRKYNDNTCSTPKKKKIFEKLEESINSAYKSG